MNNPIRSSQLWPGYNYKDWRQQDQNPVGVCLQGSAPLDRDFLLPRACRKTELVYKNTLDNNMKWILHRNDSIHIKLQLGKKTMAEDTTGLSRHDCWTGNNSSSAPKTGTGGWGFNKTMKQQVQKQEGSCPLSSSHESYNHEVLHTHNLPKFKKPTSLLRLSNIKVNTKTPFLAEEIPSRTSEMGVRK